MAMGNGGLSSRSYWPCRERQTRDKRRTDTRDTPVSELVERGADPPVGEPALLKR